MIDMKTDCQDLQSDLVGDLGLTSSNKKLQVVPGQAGGGSFL